MVDLADVLYGLNWLFLLGPNFDCFRAADVNEDAIVDLSDSVATLFVLFLPGQGPMPPPFPDCGPDATPNGLPCSSSFCL